MIKNTMSSEQDRFYALERFGKFQEILEPGFFTQTPVAVDGRSPQKNGDDVMMFWEIWKVWRNTCFFNLRCFGD